MATEKTRASFDLSDAIMEDILEQYPSIDEQMFSVFITHLINRYAQIFIPDEEHSEYFDVMAENIQLLAKHARKEISN